MTNNIAVVRWHAPNKEDVSGMSIKRRRKDSPKPIKDSALLMQVYRARRIGASTCFLCGVRLGSRNRSLEDVFPLWLQERYKLHDQEILLVNETPIPYRQLKIPCCTACNNKHLSKIEKAIQVAVSRGPAAVAALPPHYLLVWLSKIMYGLLYKEHFLPYDRSNPVKGRLVRRAFLQRFKMFHFFMQSARLPFAFEGFFPASIVVLDVKVPEDPRGQFDFSDNPFVFTVAIRMGPVGIIAALHDGGAQEMMFGHVFEQYRSTRWHPLQYTEIATKFLYKASLMNRTPKYINFERDKQIVVTQMPLGGLSSRPLFDEWDQYSYARMLAVRTGYPFDFIYVPPDKVRTWLDDGSENVPDIPIDEPWEIRDRKDRLKSVTPPFRLRRL